MTRIVADTPCAICGSVIVPRELAFGVIIPTEADYICVKCRAAYRWMGQPPRLTMLRPVARNTTD